MPPKNKKKHSAAAQVVNQEALDRGLTLMASASGKTLANVGKTLGKGNVVAQGALQAVELAKLTTEGGREQAREDTERMSRSGWVNRAAEGFLNPVKYGYGITDALKQLVDTQHRAKKSKAAVSALEGKRAREERALLLEKQRRAMPRAQSESDRAQVRRYLQQRVKGNQ